MRMTRPTSRQAGHVVRARRTPPGQAEEGFRVGPGAAGGLPGGEDGAVEVHASEGGVDGGVLDGGVGDSWAVTAAADAATRFRD